MSSALQLDIEGMTCAACATRIEKALNAVQGVEASVNYATERATILSGGADPTALLKAVEGAGYHASLHTEDSVSSEEPPDRLLSRLVVSAAITIPIVLLSMVPLLQFYYWQWVVSVLAIPVVTWGAWPFHRAAWVNAARAVATMDTLISLGVLAASGWSVWAMLFGGAARTGMTMTVSLFGQPGSDSHEIYWEVAAAVTTFMLLGRYLEHRAKRDAGAALRALMESGAKEATLRTPEGDVVVAIARVRQGDLMVVRPGERIPTDGEILEGSAAIDTSMMTGESLPRDAGPGDSVFGGTINTSGLLVIRATRVGKDTELARMAQLVENAQTGKSQAQRLADRVSAVFVPIVIVIAAVTFVGWLALGGPLEVAFQAAVATLIIACPCALGLATPTALLVGTGRGAQLGLLIRGPEVLEHSRNIDTVILDKTGTLTTGNMVVTQVISSHATTEAQVVALAAGVETGSEHPLAHAVLRYAGQTEVSPVVASEFHTVAGRGQRALVANQPAAVGQLAWLEDIGFTVSNSLREEITSAIKGGSTVIAVGTDSKVLGAVVIADSVKDTSKAAVSQLVALGLTPVMATGDNAVVAARIAREVGITSVYSGLTPEGKTALVTTLQEQGHQVAMVGDGINDAPALATADLGIAMGTGTDAAMTAGDITVVSGDLRSVSDAIRLARRTLGTIRVNLFWAFAYNVAAIPLAVAALLNPIVAGLAMAFSSVFVVTNSLRLRSFRPTTVSPAGQ
jgi:Cu+-exporting ATPase